MLKFFNRFYCNNNNNQLRQIISNKIPNYLELSCSDVENDLINNMCVYEDFIQECEEDSLLNELEPYMKKLKYEFDHWDDAIHGYRETERLNWNENNTKILDRIRKLAFPQNVAPIKFVHILDLDTKGYIKPHIDAIRFCGDTIAGLSLLTDCVMRLVNENNKKNYGNCLLKRRSLYIMKGPARYHYTHEVLCNDDSFFKGELIRKNRRISIICRNEPPSINEQQK